MTPRYWELRDRGPLLLFFMGCTWPIVASAWQNGRRPPTCTHGLPPTPNSPPPLVRLLGLSRLLGGPAVIVGKKNCMLPYWEAVAGVGVGVGAGAGVPLLPTKGTTMRCCCCCCCCCSVIGGRFILVVILLAVAAEAAAARSPRS